MPADWTIVIPAYNGRELLTASLRSVFAQTEQPARVILVDNASTDGSADLVAAAFPLVHIIRNPRNRGFGAACNTGIQAALDSGARFVMLLNQDTILPPDACAAALRVMRTDDSIAAASPLQLDYAGDQLDPVFRLSVPPALTDDFDRGSLEDCYKVDFVPFVAVFIRREALESVGGFDPLYWMYAEDNDYCEMLTRRGWRIAVVPASHVHHVGGQLNARRSLRWRCNWTYGRCLLRLKWGPGPRLRSVVSMIRLAWSMHGPADPLPALYAIARSLLHLPQIVRRRHGHKPFAFRTPTPNLPN